MCAEVCMVSWDIGLLQSVQQKLFRQFVLNIINDFWQNKAIFIQKQNPKILIYVCKSSQRQIDERKKWK